MSHLKTWSCKICGRDITPTMPLLILVVVAYMDKFIPVKALFTSLGKCKHCHEMRGYNETQADDDSEELTVDEYNTLVEHSVPVMRQVIQPGDGEPDEEEGEEPEGRRKIGFCSEEDE